MAQGCEWVWVGGAVRQEGAAMEVARPRGAARTERKHLTHAGDEVRCDDLASGEHTQQIIL